jgi:hypothetical protein
MAAVLTFAALPLQFVGIAERTKQWWLTASGRQRIATDLPAASGRKPLG